MKKKHNSNSSRRDFDITQDCRRNAQHFRKLKKIENGQKSPKMRIIPSMAGDRYLAQADRMNAKIVRIQGDNDRNLGRIIESGDRY